MSLEKDTVEIKKLFEQDDLLFKPALPENLAKRIEQRVSNRKPTEDFCPHCKADLRSETIGVYSKEIEESTVGIYWNSRSGMWEWGDRNYGNGEITGFFCGKCDGKVKREKDFDLEDSL
jgi:hypothetical protein